MLRFQLGIFLLLFSILSFSQVENGVIDVRPYDFDSETENLNLDGFWFYRANFLAESTLIPDSSQLIKVPASWGDNGLPNQGYGTYQLKLIKSYEQKLGLRLPDIYSAHRLLINGKEFSGRSITANNKEQYKPYRESRLVPLDFRADTLTILIQVSNFSHSKGGIAKSISVGAMASLAHDRFKDHTFDAFLSGCLLMGSFFFLGLFFYGRHEKVSLFFALFCLTFAYRVVGWGNYMLHDLVELPYWLSIRLEYISFYLAGFFFARYLQLLFPDEAPKIWFRFFADLSLIWAALTFLPVDWFTRINTIYLFAMLAGTTLTVVVFTKAFIKKLPGATYALSSTVVILTVFGMKTVDYLGFYQEPKLLTALGQTLFFFFQAMVLSERFSLSWKKAKVTAEDNAQSKSDFLSIMSHEIRTPLNAIIGTTYHMIDENPRDDQLKELKNLKISSENLLGLINNILDFNKVDSGNIEFDEVNLDLNAFANRAISMFELSAENKGLSLELHYDSELPKAVMIDKLRATQILSNLLSNAVKFTSEGYVRLKLKKEGSNGQKVSVRFSVEDTGIGIEEDKQELVFNTFQQAMVSTTRRFGGTGLGLSITKRLVELMGARLELDSKFGYGSTFSFVLDLEIGNERELHQKVDSTFDLNGLRILIVEDNQMNTVVAVNILQKWNVNISTAENGVQAVEKVKEQDFDFILMDLQMPEMDGYEATKKIRDLGHDMPIIALTASAMLDKTSKLKAAGLDGAITKPFDPKDLYQAIIDRV